MDKTQPLTEPVFYILLSLRKPNHGYGIIQEIKNITDGRIVLSAGTLYGALQSLEKKGWIELFSSTEESRRKKEYIITTDGRMAFLDECSRLSELVEHSKLIFSRE